MPHPVGLRRLPAAWQAYVTVRGRFLSRTFPLDTPLTTMKAWREQTRAAEKYGTPTADGRTFAEDADDYLSMVPHMPTIADRTYRIQQWVDVFGPRVRASITSAEIRAQLTAWQTTGRYDGGPLSAGSLNTRRTALMAMYTALDGRATRNVVRDVPPANDRASGDVDRSRPLLELARMIRHTRPRTQSRARLRVLMWTGWPAALLKGLTAQDVDWTRGIVRVPRRQKGKGMPSLFVPVLPQAVRALRDLAHVDGWGPFSNSSLHSTLHRAALAAKLLPCRVYDLRHSWAAWAVTILPPDEVAAMMRTSVRLVSRYSQGSLTDRLTEARNRLQALQVLRGLQGVSRGVTVPTRRPARRRESP
jgi:integrase